jgi:hypothetical protein
LLVREGQKREGERPEGVFQSLRINVTPRGDRRTRFGRFDGSATQEMDLARISPVNEWVNW